jgi:hypothetical protein
LIVIISINLVTRCCAANVYFNFLADTCAVTGVSTLKLFTAIIVAVT